MFGRALFRFSQNPWANGLRLAALNAVLAGFCVVSFFGVLEGVTLISHWRFAQTGNHASELPFPYLTLFAVYTVMFLVAWTWCARRLPGNARARLQVAAIATLPFVALALLGVAAIAGMIVMDAFGEADVPVAGVFIFGLLSVLIVLAGLTCVGVMVCWRRGESGTQ